jgi:hypothetical protein
MLLDATYLSAGGHFILSISVQLWMALARVASSATVLAISMAAIWSIPASRARWSAFQ